jgi:DNA repair protein NreA
MVSTARMCLVCKGSRALCGQVHCPLMARINIEPKMRDIPSDFFGPSTSVFVGRIGYPRVNVGPLAAVEYTKGMDNPSTWFGMDYSKLIELRSLMLRSKVTHYVKSRDRFVLENQELALADRPTDVEMSFKSKPIYRVSFNDIVQPMGPSAMLESMKLAENPHIPRKVDYIVSDDIKAAQAGVMLYEKGQDVYRISTILSSGVLGKREARKMVPTRWSIVATQDMITQDLLTKVRDFPQVNEFMVYSSKFLDNHFEILLMPGNWEFENFEAWAPGSMWTANLKHPEIIGEFEPFTGRKRYADQQGGGYYASRLGVTEGLAGMGRQARAVVFREVYEGYTVPLGSWQILENVRHAFTQTPLSFATRKEALEHIESRLRLPMQDYVHQSRLLKQKRLFDFAE